MNNELPPLQDFFKMPRSEARVAIAKDVLERIDYRNVQAGVYLARHEVLSCYDYDVEDARCLVDKLEKCSACALGNMLLSHIRLFNQVKTREVICSKTSVCRPINDYFSNRQLDLIEAAFEGELINSELHRDDDDVINAIDFGNNKLNPKDRLIAIMENIVQNNGIFIP